MIKVFQLIHLLQSYHVHKIMRLYYILALENVPLKNQTASGNAYGLRLILNVEQYKYYSDFYTPGQPDAGIRYALHYYKVPPNMIAESFLAATGFHTYVPMTLKYVSKNDHPRCQISLQIIIIIVLHVYTRCLYHIILLISS